MMSAFSLGNGYISTISTTLYERIRECLGNELGAAWVGTSPSHLVQRFSPDDKNVIRVGESRAAPCYLRKKGPSQS
jgi:hypothetical protein